MGSSKSPEGSRRLVDRRDRSHDATAQFVGVGSLTRPESASEVSVRSGT